MAYDAEKLVMAQGLAEPIEDNSAEADKDEVGFTNPNLHRRMKTELEKPDDVLDMEISLRVQGVESYRTTSYTVHDEESTTCEIP